MTTTTVYPDANAESTSVDGYLQRNATVSWTDTRNGTGNDVDPSGAAMYWTQGEKNGTQFINTRNAMLFDTSAIPDTDVISAAVLSVYRNAAGIESDLGGVQSNIVSCAPASNTNLVNGDYEIANWGTTEFSTRKSQGDFGTDAYADFTLDANGIANISKTGVSKFGERNSFDLDNTTPTVRSYMEIATADTALTTKDPKLVITHAAPPATAVKDIIGMGIIAFAR